MIKLITPPTAEPVTTAEVKAQLRVDYTDDDSYIDGLITAARVACEEYAHMAFLTQTWDQVLDNAGSSIDLPRPPLQSVTGVYVTDDGVEAQVDASLYRVDMISTPGRLFLKPGNAWPSYTDQAGFRIRYVAGYTSAQNVPRSLRQATIMLAAFLYRNRGEMRAQAQFASELSASIPTDILMLLDPFKVYL